VVTYGQWSAKRQLLPVTWACGAESVLAREVVAEYRRAFPALPVTTVDASLVSAREAWDEILSQPSGGRVTVVAEAQRLFPSPLFPVLVGEASLTYPVIFTTPDPAYARKDGDHLEAIAATSRAQVVRCVPPSKESDLVALVTSWWPGAGEGTALAVLERCGGSLALAREACEKAVRADLPPGMSEIVCRTPAENRYADLVTAGDTERAFPAAALVPDGEVLGTIRLLAYRLSVLGQLNAALREGLSPQQQVLRLKADPFLLRKLRPHAREYGVRREMSCREVLAMAEVAAQGGARVGVLESVAVLW
jgi:hypothetical protein